MLSFLLNLPYTCLGFAMGIFSLPKSFKINKNPFAIIIKIGSFWWAVGYLKGLRATTFGNVIILGPKTEDKDFEHELVHLEQYKKEPLVHPFLYLIELVKNGYKNNKYEVEAYKIAGNKYRSS